MSHITLILHSLQWLGITESIEYKILTYRVLTTTRPLYLYNLITAYSWQHLLSSIVTLIHPLTYVRYEWPIVSFVGFAVTALAALMLVTKCRRRLYSWTENLHVSRTDFLFNGSFR